MMKGSQQQRLFSILHALSAKRFAPLTGDDLRDARLSWLSTFLGRTVASSKTLSAFHLKRCIDQLLREVDPATAKRWRPGRGQQRRDRKGARPDGAATNVIAMPNRNLVTDRQVWKIRQIEAYLGWSDSPERLGGFLLQWYKVRRPEELTFSAAVRAIDSLIAVTARAAIKARKGDAYKVDMRELRAEVECVKTALHYWQPPGEEPPPPEAA